MFIRFFSSRSQVQSNFQQSMWICELFHCFLTRLPVPLLCGRALLVGPGWGPSWGSCGFATPARPCDGFGSDWIPGEHHPAVVERGVFGETLSPALPHQPGSQKLKRSARCRQGGFLRSPPSWVWLHCFFFLGGGIPRLFVVLEGGNREES